MATIQLFGKSSCPKVLPFAVDISADYITGVTVTIAGSKTLI